MMMHVYLVTPVKVQGDTSKYHMLKSFTSANKNAQLLCLDTILQVKKKKKIFTLYLNCSETIRNPTMCHNIFTYKLAITYGWLIVYVVKKYRKEEKYLLKLFSMWYFGKNL